MKGATMVDMQRRTRMTVEQLIEEATRFEFNDDNNMCIVHFAGKPAQTITDPDIIKQINRHVAETTDWESRAPGSKSDNLIF